MKSKNYRISAWFDGERYFYNGYDLNIYDYSIGEVYWTKDPHDAFQVHDRLSFLHKLLLVIEKRYNAQRILVEEI